MAIGFDATGNAKSAARCGFEVAETEDRTACGIAFFSESLAGSARGTPPLGLHIVMGATAREKFQNMLANLDGGAIAPVVMIATRTA